MNKKNDCGRPRTGRPRSVMGDNVRAVQVRMCADDHAALRTLGDGVVSLGVQRAVAVATETQRLQKRFEDLAKVFVLLDREGCIRGLDADAESMCSRLRRIARQTMREYSAHDLFLPLGLCDAVAGIDARLPVNVGATIDAGKTGSET